MEKIKSLQDKIAEFIVDSSSGDGYGDGSGDGSGYGSGSGYGHGHGDGSGSGSRSGSGYGHEYGHGDGHGSGHGDGSGSGYGHGDGYGDGDGIKSLNNNPVILIDNIQTIVFSIRQNILKGAILNSDLTTTPCYVVKKENLFAHGTTIEEAFNSVEKKFILKSSIESRIQLFLEKFNLTEKYPAKLFFEWHHIITGSCEFGRISFCKKNNINIETDYFTVKEFIDIVKNEYGKENIKILRQSINSF